jgi:hypothetical protein
MWITRPIHVYIYTYNQRHIREKDKTIKKICVL